MSDSSDNLTAQVRENTGQSSNRKLREDSIIPAVVYGRGINNRNLSVRKGDLEPLLKDGAMGNRLLELDVEEEEESRSVLIKDLELDPVTDGILHVDFHQVQSEDTVQVEVPVELKGESPGVELEGGIIDQPMRTLTVECEVKDIPESFELEIDELDIGDAIFVSDVDTKSGIRLQNNPQRTIISIQPPEEFEVDTTPAEETEAIEETVEEAMEEVAEGEEGEVAEEGEEPEADESGEGEEF